MALRKLTSWLYEPFHQGTEAEFHRRLLIISGSEKRCNERLTSLLSNAPSNLVIQQIGRNQAATIGSFTRKHLLGNECDIGVLNAHDTFTPGDLMALTGTIRSAGCLIISCPTFDTWPKHTHPAYISHGFSVPVSHYITHFINIVTNTATVAIWDKSPPKIPDLINFRVKTSPITHSSLVDYASAFKSHCQQHGFETLQGIWQTDTPKAVITAPRGRGKSALLGMFIGDRITKDKRIVISSTVRENTVNLFKHLSHCVPELIQVSPTHFKHPQNGATIEWFAPDNPALTHIPADVLVIDEAASFPLPMLKRLLSAAHAWVLSTTLQGYEGSGQGFIHRMLPEFKRSGATTVTLTTPIRWVNNDKLEALVNRICLFEPTTPNHFTNECPTSNIGSPLLSNSLTYTRCKIHELNNDKLSAVMRLLALAHYQTTPDDFMRLLDSPDVELVVQYYQQQIIGVVVINSEGGEKLASLAPDIAQGSRRPKGHLGAQRIALLTSNPNTATYNYWRINRIAVQPDYQNMGLGSKLLAYIHTLAVKSNIDGVITSYGQTSSLNNFWNKCGYCIVDNGLKPNKASGETSALVINAISQRFKETSSLLVRMYGIESRNKVIPLSDIPQDINAVYITKIIQFINGTRTLEQTQYPIASLACELVKPYNKEACREADTLLKMLMKVPFDTTKLTALLKATGRKQLSQQLRTHLASMLNVYTPPN